MASKTDIIKALGEAAKVVADGHFTGVAILLMNDINGQEAVTQAINIEGVSPSVVIGAFEIMKTKLVHEMLVTKKEPPVRAVPPA